MFFERKGVGLAVALDLRIGAGYKPGFVMASFSQVTKRKRAQRKSRAGTARKAKQSRRSTLSYDELFAGFGEPGQPAPKLKVQAAS